MAGALALRLLTVLFLIAANAFFVASEFVLVSSRHARLKQLEEAGHAAASIALRLQGQIDRVISATQLGITLASLGLGWVGENATADALTPLFVPLLGSKSVALAHTIALVVAFAAISAM